MARALRDYRERAGVDIGFKPAGGLRTAKDGLAWLILMKEELGPAWLEPDLFRIGASSLLTDIERQLEHFATGRYSAAPPPRNGVRRPAGAVRVICGENGAGKSDRGRARPLRPRSARRGDHSRQGCAGGEPDSGGQAVVSRYRAACGLNS